MAFYFLRKYRFMKNKRLMLFIANEYIDKCEKDSFYPSCKDVLLKAISKEIDYYQSDFAVITNEDELAKDAKSLVSSLSFDLATTGEYHLLGVFNYHSVGGSLVRVHQYAVKDALDKGYITQEEFEEDALALKEAILQRL